MPDKRPLLDGGTQDGIKQSRSDTASPAPVTNVAKRNPDLAAKIAAAKAKAAAVIAGNFAKSTGPAPSRPSPALSASPAPSHSSIADVARAKREAMKAKVAQLAANAGPTNTAHPSRTESPRPPPAGPALPSQWQNPYTVARGGLSVGLHPSLVSDATPETSSKGMSAAPKFSTTMGNIPRDATPIPDQGESRETNPYLSHDAVAEGKGRDRKRRELVFHPKGKFIAQGVALRKQAQMEAMKKRISAQAKKAGVDDDNEKNFLVPVPPDIEWWDEGLVNGKNYDDLEHNAKIDTEDSIITAYIQHPVLMEPPQEKLAPPPKPMFLTKQEQAKLRRQRRMEEHKEQQAKIRLGLEPPPPPKVKASNLMRVLGEQAVKDPTAVEGRVREEIETRARAHQAMNAERKLTREQRHEKIAEKQEKDLAKGVHICVFKIDSLAYKKHRFQIDMNAKQHMLTGICILHPRMNLIIIEGGARGVAKYKQLALNRIRWTENAPPESEVSREADQAWLRSVNEQGELKDHTSNKCQLVWQGEEREPKFRKWSSRVCETDSDAKEALSWSKMENMWTLAKSMK